MAIAKINKTYLKNLIEYRAVLLQRNKLLQEKAADTYYEVWESALAKYGNEIYQERRKIVPTLLIDAQKYYSVFMRNREISFEYKVNLDSFESEVNNQQEKFLALLKTNRAKEQELGHTIIGPHRDDIVIKEKSLVVRKFGSEGEQRLAALSLKLAEAELLTQNNRKPIFLLDEVASELDTINTQKLFELIQGQFFYATAKDYKSIINRDGKIYYVEKGKITKTETTR
jgi:DNA replication and repair protein RecF